MTHRSCLELFTTDAMIEKICTCTNDVIEQYKVHYSKKDLTQIRNICPNEIKALFGLLIFSGVHKDNKLSTEEMFSSTGSPLYRAIMSERRFQFLLRCLRFDNLNTRSQRKHTDQFASVRNIWNQFIEACKS